MQFSKTPKSPVTKFFGTLMHQFLTNHLDTSFDASHVSVPRTFTKAKCSPYEAFHNLETKFSTKNCDTVSVVYSKFPAQQMGSANYKCSQLVCLVLISKKQKFCENRTLLFCRISAIFPKTVAYIFWAFLN